MSCNISDNVKKVIGSHGEERFKLFKSVGEWHLGVITLSEISVSNFNMFFEDVETIKLGECSIFMTDEGHIRLEWYDDICGESELEFGENNIYIYLEDVDIEGHYDFQSAIKIFNNVVGDVRL